MMTFTGTEYLYIDIANQYGLDKEDWNTRIKWTTDNINNLEDYTQGMDDPFLYVKAVKALRDTQAGKETGFIMGLDACSSGVQILSALTGCSTGAANCGLIDTGHREDFYTNVTDKMNSLLKTTNTWSRDVVKNAAMTVAYGSKREPIKAFGKSTKELKAFYIAMEKLSPGVMMAMRIIQNQWDPTGTEHCWTMPDGHKVIAKVLIHLDKRIEVDEFNHATFTYRSEINAPDEHGLSLVANITHAVDGWIVREMVRRAFTQGFQMTAIHDSFWAHPNHMNKVRQNYLDIMIEIVKSTMLVDILKEITGKNGSITRLDPNMAKKMQHAEYALS